MTKPLKFMTTFEVAEAVGYHHRTILRMCEDGRIKAIRPGRDYRIPSTEVDRLLKPVADKEEA